MLKRRVASRQQARSTSNRGEVPTSSDPILARAKYRSKLEDKIAKQLTDSGIEFSYETLKISYMVPARKAKYTPDFVVGDMVIEAKGRFRTAQDRQKLLLVKEQYPDLDLRLVFQNAKTPIYPKSPTSCSKWADDNGFLWADNGKIPEEWLQQSKYRLQNYSN